MESYKINEMFDIGKNGVEKIKSYLESIDNILIVEDVQNVREYQHKDIDLRYLTKTNIIVSIEVKTDRYYNTGNFFFETISNKQKNTPGCFMYTEADYIYYYYNTVNMIYKIPVVESRQWFINHMNSFKTKETSTDNYYITIGKLVPRKIIMEYIDIEVINI
jgi:hypothetical protein